MLGDTPSLWTDWLKANNYFVPDDIRYAYAQRAPGPDYEDGAAAPKWSG